MGWNRLTSLLTYDSGERDMRGMLANGATASVFSLQRVGRLVTLAVVNLQVPGDSSQVVLGTAAMVSGFRPSTDRQQMLGTIDYSIARLRVLPAGTTSLFRGSGGGSYSGTLTYLVPPALPATLPGDSMEGGT